MYPHIPEGWYQLGKDDEVKMGDMLCSNWNNTWSKVDWNCGPARNHDAYTFIRKGSPPEKEWLNPWD